MIIAFILLGEYRGECIREDADTIPWIRYAKVTIKDTLPPAVDLSSFMPPVGDQSSQGSCTAWATGYYAKSFYEWKEHRWDLKDPEHQFSPAFIYNQINGGVDKGSRFSDAFKVLNVMGCASMTDFPYNPYNYTNWPSENVYRKAIPYRCEGISKINTLRNEGIKMMKQMLADTNVLVMGIEVWDNFYSISSYGNVYCVADKTGAPRAGHAVTIVGYDDNKVTKDGKGAFKLVNSWGPGWGDNGYFWMSYEAVKDPTMCHGWAYKIIDKIDYTPELLVKVKIEHPARELVQMNLGVEKEGNACWKSFVYMWSYQYAKEITPHPFPNDYMVFDMTDAVEHMNKDTVHVEFITCKDIKEDGNKGKLLFFSCEYLPNNEISISSDTPLDIPDPGSATAYTKILIPLGIKEVLPEETIKVNIIRKEKIKFTIKSSSGKIHFSIYDAQGRRIKGFTTHSKKREIEFIWKPKHNPRGIYFYILQTKKAIRHGKLIIF